MIKFDESKPSIIFIGQEYKMQYSLWRLLKFLYENKNNIQSYDSLEEFTGCKKDSVKNMIMLIKRQIPGIPIQNIRGAGYMWKWI